MISNQGFKMKKYVPILIALFFSVDGYSATWSPALTVEDTFTEGSTDIVAVSTSGGQQYTAGCHANKWVFVADSEERRSRAFSVIMAAVASGKKVSLWYDTENCAAWNYHKATSIKFIK